MRFGLIFAAVITATLPLSGCGFVIGHVIRESSRKSETESQVNASLARYSRLVVEQDVARLVDMFVPNGELLVGNDRAVVGPEQIGTFLKVAMENKVTDYSMTATSNKIEGSEVDQFGTYSQSTAAPGGAVKTTGTFEAMWQRQIDGRWLLKKMQIGTHPAGAGS